MSDEYCEAELEEDFEPRYICSYCGYEDPECSYCGDQLEGKFIHDHNGYHYCDLECRAKHIKSGKTKEEEGKQ